MLIEIVGLRLALGGNPILHDVHLSLHEGEIYGLLGPNGAGKSTTIAAALGLLQPDAGQVRVLGKDPSVSAHEIYGALGVLPEQNGFYDWMSAEEYLAFFAALHGRHPGPSEMQQLAAAVGLAPRPRQAIGTYSLGMRQRLGLARALIAEPTVLVLDEPTNGLDPRGRREIHDILLGLAGRGVGILLCTHLLDDVDRLCRRVGIIVEGRTVTEGAIADLVRNEHRQVRFRLRLAGEPPSELAKDGHVSVVAHEGDWWIVDLDPAATPEAAWRELMFRGWPIAEIARESGGLEDLYLALTERRRHDRNFPDRPQGIR
ncbi:MAG: ABC transporter ATP-binding protein [Rhodospirillales bacterium]|nr:ABC transporter ATP-binding protein [Rhodospirillales bacterium]